MNTMADLQTGKVIYRHLLSPLLEIFRIQPNNGGRFPAYQAGQNIDLSRDHCKLTKKIFDERGNSKLIYDLDENGNPKLGRVTRTYSIASAPFETIKKKYLEFYVALDPILLETPGRLTESLFHIDPEGDNHVGYSDKPSGDFTLEQRTAGFENVVMIGTGTGLAPLVSMTKQLHHESLDGKKHHTRYTLFHTNRTREELGYHSELLSIEASHLFDFVYVPSVSRPTKNDIEDSSIGIGRVTNILREIFGMKLKSEHHQIDPRLPKHISNDKLLVRMETKRTVILSCGNHDMLKEVRSIAEPKGMRFEKEDW